MVPVAALASGKPVIAYARGGVLETVVDGKTGLLFSDQSVEGLATAVERFKSTEAQFDPAEIHAHARQFSPAHFAGLFRDFVDESLADRA